MRRGDRPAGEAVERCLAAAADPGGEGDRTFTRRYDARARAEAQAVDDRTRAGAARGALAGLPVSIKDLFDVAGEPTRAGSTVLAEAPPARRDAAIVARLRALGAVIVGKTNMTEFAFSGLGLNPHFGTPLNPFDRAGRRIPGGSSSGAAVSVADGMAWAAIGSDTGGSARIPAAFCGLAGFKPTQDRYPRAGMLPLSPTLDAVGLIARSARDCRFLDAALTGAPPPGAPCPVGGLRLAVPTSYAADDMDADVAAAFEAALRRLAGAGAHVVHRPMPALDLIADIHAHGTFPAAESYRWHARLLAEHAGAYDPRVAVRIQKGRAIDAAAVAAMRAARARFAAALATEFLSADLLVMPTVPIVAPRLAALDDDDDYARLNLLVLRNPTIVNLAGACAISLPCPVEGAPVGLMLVAPGGDDDRLLAAAAGVEAALQPRERMLLPRDPYAAMF